MKKFMLFVLGSAILATSAIANDAKTQPASKPGEIVKAATIKKFFTNVNFYGSNGIASTLNISAYNTSTGISYPLTVYSNFPSNNSDYISIPTGNYNITVWMNETASIYINSVGSTYSSYYTFYDVAVTTQFALVVDVQY